MQRHRWKNWTHLRKYRHDSWGKSEVRIRWSMKQGQKGRKSSCCVTDGHLSFAEWRIGGSDIVETIRGLVQHSPNQDHQHHKKQQQTSRISFPDCLVVQDKQLTQYLQIPRSEREMHRRCWKFRSQNVQIFWHVYTIGQNHGPVWKTQVFYLSEICIFFWVGLYGKSNLRKFEGNTVGIKFRIQNVHSSRGKRDYSRLCTWTIYYTEGNSYTHFSYIQNLL